MEYIHQERETFKESCTQSAASYKASQEKQKLVAAKDEQT